MASEKEIEFLQDNFDFAGLKKAKFFDKETKAKDHDKQIERICQYFDLKTIFHYEIVGIETKKNITPKIETFSNN